MSLTVTCVLESTRGGSDTNQQRTYNSKYRIKQTDAGSRASAPALITAAQAVMAGDPLPLYGDNYTDAGDTDVDSYAMSFNWNPLENNDHEKLLFVDVTFQPASSFTPGKLQETDPLLWETEYWVEWTEEQVVLEEATVVEDLSGLLRSAGSLGKVVNGCGIEFTEPLMKTIYYPVLHAQKQYATLEEIVALNTTYQNTTNSGAFFDASARKAKYLGTESGRIQKINGQSFYVGITRIWFKEKTWDRKVLNNGWGHFEKNPSNPPSLLYDGGGYPILFKNKVHDDPTAAADDPDSDPDTPSSEPLNLKLDGTLVKATEEPVYITYRDLEEVDYSGIGIGG